MAAALILATEDDANDAVVDIATLTGSVGRNQGAWDPAEHSRSGDGVLIGLPTDYVTTRLGSLPDTWTEFRTGSTATSRPSPTCAATSWA
jgi:hypothetical protein